MSGVRILIVDDELDARNLLSKVIQKEGYEVQVADSGEKAVQEFQKHSYPVVLIDYQMSGMNGIETLEKIREMENETRIIMITSHGSIKLAVEAISKGAYNFLEKPFDLDEVRLSIQNAISSYRILRENQNLRDQISKISQNEIVLGKSKEMQEVWHLVQKAAPSDSPVLITGESGTGKEVVAKALHAQSQRSKGPFIAINCAALPADLIESELFGHVKGAFTGAISAKKGRFEIAEGGTLFLDEIGEIAIELQPKLLRVIQEKTFERVGDSQTRKADVRILAATNRELEESIKRGGFREDLFYRLNVIQIEILPLRKRRGDIEDLIHFFMGKIAVRMGKPLVTINPDALAALKNYAFPGNIRELMNMIERAIILCDGNCIELEDLSFSDRKDQEVKKIGDDSETHLPKKFKDARGEFELSYLTRLLTLSLGNISQAARMAGIDRNNFKEKMHKYGLQPSVFKE